MYILKYAYLNAWRNRRRTIVNMSVFAICVSMIIFFVGIYRFRITDGVSKATRYRTGHVQVHAKGYDEASRNLPLDIIVPDSAKLVGALLNNSEVLMASERIRFFAYASNGSEQLQCTAVAIDPEKEKSFSLVPDSVFAGRYLQADDAGVILTEKISRALELKTGDVVRLKARTRYGTPNIIDAEVVGLVHPPFGASDQTTIFLPLGFAREFLMMDSSSTEILVAAKELSKAFHVLAYVRALPQSKFLEAFDWKHYETALVTDIRIDTRFFAIFFGILMLIAVFIMNNAISMSVFERTRELGTIRAIGMTKNALVVLVSSESALIGLAGALAGCLLGGLICWYFAVYGIKVQIGELSSIPVSSRLYTASSVWEYIGCIFLGIIAGWIGGLRPAFLTRRLRIVESLHD